MIGNPLARAERLVWFAVDMRQQSCTHARWPHLGVSGRVTKKATVKSLMNAGPRIDEKPDDKSQYYLPASPTTAWHTVWGANAESEK